MIRRTFGVLAMAHGFGILSPGGWAAEPVNLVFDGDSISAGSGASAGGGLDARVAAGLGDGVSVRNVAVAGRPVSECLRLYPRLVAPLFRSTGTDNVIAFHAGDNDITQGRDAERTYAAFTAYVAAAHRQGWKLLVSTEMLRPDFVGPPAKELEAYNAMLRRNSAGADTVVDFDVDPRIADLAYRGNRALFTSDGVHPSDGGYAVLASLMVPALKRLTDR